MWLERREHVGEWQEVGVEREPGARPWVLRARIRTLDSTLSVIGRPGKVWSKGLI